MQDQHVVDLWRGNPLKLKRSESVQSLVTSQFYFREVTEAELAESEARSGILQRTHSRDRLLYQNSGPR